MEGTMFSEKVEAYFSELGRWKVWRSILLGQVLSLLLSGKCILTTLLQSATWQFPISAQQVISYVFLFVLFTPATFCDGLKPMQKGWWIVVIASIIDVEAGYLLILSQRYTSVLS